MGLICVHHKGLTVEQGRKKRGSKTGLPGRKLNSEVYAGKYFVGALFLVFIRGLLTFLVRMTGTIFCCIFPTFSKPERVLEFNGYTENMTVAPPSSIFYIFWGISICFLFEFDKFIRKIRELLVNSATSLTQPFWNLSKRLTQWKESRNKLQLLELRHPLRSSSIIIFPLFPVF